MKYWINEMLNIGLTNLKNIAVYCQKTQLVATLIINCSWVSRREERVSKQNQSEISNDAQLRTSEISSSQFGRDQPTWLSRQPRLAISLQGFITLYEHFIIVLLSIITSYTDKQIQPEAHTATQQNISLEILFNAILLML